MKAFRPTLWIHLGLLSLVMGACSTAPYTSRVTLSEGGCTYAGPRQVQARLSIAWELAVEPSMDTGFAIITLREGKTLEDLRAIIGADMHPQPAWVTAVVLEPDAAQGKTTRTYDLRENAAYHGEPIYFVCFREAKLLGAAGPIAVTP